MSLPKVGSAGPGETNAAEGAALKRNFIYMAVCFSANHGAVTSVIALSSSFDPTLGSYSVGLLYGCYVLTAMLVGSYVISVTSAKRVLIVSLAMYAVYVASYLLAAAVPATAWPAILFGATVGGVGAGLLWTAQGAYFKINAKQYARAMGISEESATGLFSSTFAAFYLGLEVALKITGSLTATYGSDAGKYAIYAFYSIIAVGATFVIAGIREMVPEDNNEPVGAAPPPGCTKVNTKALTPQHATPFSFLLLLDRRRYMG